MKNSKKYNHIIFHNDMFSFDSANASSATDCTGLIPSAPQNEYELDSYNEIIDYSPEYIDIYNKNED